MNDESVDDELQLGYGGSAELEMPLSRYFTLGGAGTATAWQAELEDEDARRNVVADFDVVPRLRVPFGSGGPHGQVHVGVPVGLAVNFPSDDYAEALQNVGGELSNGVGLHVGARAGGEFFFTRRFGLVGEIGFDYRALRHRIEGPLGGEEKFTLNLTSWSAQAGFVIAL